MCIYDDNSQARLAQKQTACAPLHLRSHERRKGRMDKEEAKPKTKTRTKTKTKTSTKTKREQNLNPRTRTRTFGSEKGKKEKRWKNPTPVQNKPINSALFNYVYKQPSIQVRKSQYTGKSRAAMGGHQAFAGPAPARRGPGCIFLFPSCFIHYVAHRPTFFAC